jgi:hypothetical protein
MTPELNHLEMKCLRTAQDFLSLDWGMSSARVRSAVNAVILGPPRDAAALKFLLEESVKLPVQFEPARRLHDLVEATAELHTQHQRATNFQRWATKGAA